MRGFQLVDVGESTRFACTRRCYDKPLVGRWWRLKKNKSVDLPLAADILSSDVDGGGADGGESGQWRRVAEVRVRGGVGGRVFGRGRAGLEFDRCEFRVPVVVAAAVEVGLG